MKRRRRSPRSSPLAATLCRHRADPDVLTRIRQEGLERSKVQALFATLTDQFGPRLAGTPAHKQSAEWARDRMREFGLERSAARAVDVRPRLGARQARGRDGRAALHAAHRLCRGVVRADQGRDRRARRSAVAGRTGAEVAAMKDRLSGAIVLTQPDAAFIKEDRPQPSTSDAPVRIGQPPPVAAARQRRRHARHRADAARGRRRRHAQDERRRARHRVRARPRPGG